MMYPLRRRNAPIVLRTGSAMAAAAVVIRPAPPAGHPAPFQPPPPQYSAPSQTPPAQNRLLWPPPPSPPAPVYAPPQQQAYPTPVAWQQPPQAGTSPAARPTHAYQAPHIRHSSQPMACSRRPQFNASPFAHMAGGWRLRGSADRHRFRRYLLFRHFSTVAGRAEPASSRHRRQVSQLGRSGLPGRKSPPIRCRRSIEVTGLPFRDRKFESRSRKFRGGQPLRAAGFADLTGPAVTLWAGTWLAFRKKMRSAPSAFRIPNVAAKPAVRKVPHRAA